MKPTDLRIGNFVRADDYYPYAEIDGVYREYVSIGAQLYTYEAIEPIPLTEDWLFKLGFVKSTKYWYKINYKVYTDMGGTQINELSINPDIGKCNLEFVGYIDAPIETYSSVTTDDNHCQYVHQLQNLYFALTGEELKLKA